MNDDDTKDIDPIEPEDLDEVEVDGEEKPLSLDELADKELDEDEEEDEDEVDFDDDGEESLI